MGASRSAGWAGIRTADARVVNPGGLLQDCLNPSTSGGVTRRHRARQATGVGPPRAKIIEPAGVPVT